MDTTTARVVTSGTPSDNYRFDHPRISDVVHDMYIRKSELGSGDAVAAFDLPTTDGGRLTSADLASSGQHALVIFGSRTCPVTESAAEGLLRLHTVYGQQIRFVMVQVREAHPGRSIGQPKTLAQKLLHGIALKRHHQLPFEVAVDDIDGTLHRTLGTRPNSAYVIAPSGTILFRAALRTVLLPPPREARAPGDGAGGNGDRTRRCRQRPLLSGSPHCRRRLPWLRQNATRTPICPLGASCWSTGLSGGGSWLTPDLQADSRSCRDR